MSSATLTLIGLYDYDNTIFDNLTLPEGIEKNLVIDSILMRGGDYEVTYPNADLLKELIGSWSSQWNRVFYNWNRATTGMDEIRPLDNYDRHESWTDDETTHSESTDNMTGSGNTTGSDSSHGSGNVTDTSKISAEDSNSFVNRTQDTSTNSTDTSSSTSTNSTTNTNSNAESDGTRNGVHSGHIYGNIGVTTSAQMFKEFYDVMRQYGNIYDSIATVFCQSFVIPIL